jgi:hypothetical protein
VRLGAGQGSLEQLADEVQIVELDVSASGNGADEA